MKLWNTGTPIDSEKPSDAVAKTTDNWWSFHPELFSKFKRALEADFSYDKKCWKYSGGSDLLLFNAIFDHEKKEAELGFETILAIDLEAAKKDYAIDSVVKFLELVVRLAENQERNNPVASMSNQLGIELGKKQLWDIIFDLLPFRFGDKVKKFEHFAVK